MKRNILVLLFVMVALLPVYGQEGRLPVGSVVPNELPESKVKQVLTWKDASGEHLLFLCERITSSSEDGESFRNAELFAHHYILKGGKGQQTWSTYDFNKVCSEDVKAQFVPNASCVTDLDGDGESEVWLVYMVGCKGDVSPWGMKIIMHEGKKKYAMRGEQLMHGMGGKYKFDEAFQKGPVAFRDFGKKLWDKYKSTNL